MANYYFIISALPSLSLDGKPEISFKEFKDLLLLNLTEKDLRQVERLLRPIDFYNLRALWLNEPLSDKGNFNAKDLEEELLDQGTLPTYLVDYLSRYESISDRLRYFASLYASLYREIPQLKGFLRKYYQLERDIRLILTAFRAKEVGRDIIKELQFEDPTDLLIADILAQKEASNYVPPQEYEDLKTLFMENRSDPQKLQKMILQYRFDRIEEMEESQDFSIDRVLAYMARLMIVESWFELDRAQGKTILGNLSQYG